MGLQAQQLYRIRLSNTTAWPSYWQKGLKPGKCPSSRYSWRV